MRLYKCGRGACAVILKTYFRCVVEGIENVPAAGGFVLTGNHVSYLDPPALGVACPRPVHFMAKAELFNMPILSKVLPQVGAFPVHRGAADRSAIRHALEVLAQGEIVGVFPEGTRSRSGELLAPHGGAAMLALKAGVPVVPAAIWGTAKVDGFGHLPRPVRVGVRFGKPITFANSHTVDREAVATASVSIMNEIAHILAECPK